MILAIIGGTTDQHFYMIEQLNKAIGKDYEVNHVNTNYLQSYQSTSKIAAALRYRSSDVVTVITGIRSEREFTQLHTGSAKPVLCIMPGTFPPRLLTRVEITDEWLLVAPHPSELETPLKRRRYMTIVEAFSECYSRKYGFKKKEGSRYAGS